MSTYVVPVFYAVLQLIVLIAVGFVARRYGPWSDAFFQDLNRFVVRLALPLYFAVRVGRTELSDLRPLAAMPVAALLLTAVGMLLALAVFALFPYRGADRRAGLAMAAFGNSGYMPLTLAEILPVAAPVLGERFGAELPTVYVAAFLFVYSPLLWSLGNAMMTRTGKRVARPRVRDLLSPPVVGILAGLALSLAGAPRIVHRTDLPVAHLFLALERLSELTLPLALIGLGALIGALEVQRGSLTHYLRMALAVGLVRFLLLPGLFFLLLALTGLRSALAPAALFVVFLQMHTPPATNFSLMAGQTGVNREHTAVTLLLTYTAFLLLMPLYLVLLLSSTG